MQAITTKYHPPTNSRDARISAECAAAKALVKALNWPGIWSGGTDKAGDK